jgi:hypothetical protein
MDSREVGAEAFFDMEREPIFQLLGSQLPKKRRPAFPERKAGRPRADYSESENLLRRSSSVGHRLN